MNHNQFSFDGLVMTFQKYIKEFLLVGLAFIGALGGFYYLHNSKAALHEQAQLAFSQTVQEINRAERNPELWSNVELAAKTGYRSYKNSSLAPYFLAAQAQSALRQGQIKEALELLDQTLASLSKNDSFYNLFALKAARIKIDQDDVKLQDQGFEQLKSLAHDTKNHYRDAALYYLADYYKNHNDSAQAHEIGKQVAQQFGSQIPQERSPWAIMAYQQIS